MTCRFENFESAAHAVFRHTTNYAHSLFNKNTNLCTVCSWDIMFTIYFTCSCTAVARAHTQHPHDNRHWTCKRLPPDSVRDSIRIRIVAAYSIRGSTWTEISMVLFEETRKNNTKSDYYSVLDCYCSINQSLNRSPLVEKVIIVPPNFLPSLSPSASVCRLIRPS